MVALKIHYFFGRCLSGCTWYEPYTVQVHSECTVFMVYRYCTVLLTEPEPPSWREAFELKPEPSIMGQLRLLYFLAKLQKYNLSFINLEHLRFSRLIMRYENQNCVCYSRSQEQGPALIRKIRFAVCYQYIF